MDVFVSQDPRYTANHALIVLSPCPHPGLNPYFTLQRASDQTFLSADGRWLNTVERIPVREVFYENGFFSIPIDSVILQQLDTLDNYRIAVNGGEPCMMAMPDVLPAGILQGSTGALQTEAKPEPEPEPLPPDPTGDPVPPQPEPVQPQPVQEPVQEPLKDEPLTMAQNLQGQSGQAVQGREGSSRLALILGLVVLCLVIGGLVWWFVLRDAGPAPEQAPEQTPAQAEEPAQKAEPKPETMATAPKAVPFLDSAREHLRGTADPVTSLSMAKARRTPDADAATTDGAFLLIEDAAQKGQPEAMYLLGQFYDPASTLPRGSIMPDASQAKDWYGKAAAAGIAEAGPALEGLKNFLKAQAQGGDAEAARLLETF